MLSAVDGDLRVAFEQLASWDWLALRSENVDLKRQLLHCPVESATDSHINKGESFFSLLQLSMRQFPFRERFRYTRARLLGADTAKQMWTPPGRFRQPFKRRSWITWSREVTALARSHHLLSWAHRRIDPQTGSKRLPLRYQSDIPRRPRSRCETPCRPLPA
jgi:hypothetical protein